MIVWLMTILIGTMPIGGRAVYRSEPACMAAAKQIIANDEQDHPGVPSLLPLTYNCEPLPMAKS